MNCYNCGCRLSEQDFCTGCGANVKLYKKIMMVSNRYYNEGLEKAEVRDLSGAIICLRQSLKFNKGNIDARNLLGLVYFETGEVVAALSEWVISKNMCPERNIADTYLDMIQNNPTRLDTANQTIKKYNQALASCNNREDGKDLAVIQLKKVLSMNPKFIRAHQLLALLYIESEQWDKAKRELVRCRKIDTNNTLTLRYEKEVDRVLESEETVKGTGKKENGETVRYQADNELIIQPLNMKETKSGSLSSAFNILIGLIIGVAVMFFLVVPGAVAKEKNKAQEQINKLGNQMDEKTSEITELEQKVETLKTENGFLHGQLDGYVGKDGTLETIDGLLDAAKGYIAGEATPEETAAYLQKLGTDVQLEETGRSFQDLYGALFQSVGPVVADEYYRTGYDAYRKKHYPEAIEALKQACYFDPENGDAFYYIGNAYRKNGDAKEAIAAYDEVLKIVAPESERAARAERYKKDLMAEE